MVHDRRKPEHLINTLMICDEFIATCRCGWKHSCKSMKEHIAAVREHLEPKPSKGKAGE